MKNAIKMTTALLLLSAALGSCVKGDKGDTGPQGPTGSTGATGATGNANVTAYNITINSGDWVNAGSGLYYVDVPFSQITADIVSNGSVTMFEQGSSGVWIAMPYSEYVSATASLYFGFNYSLGSTRIFIQNSAGGNINFSGTYYFKAVVIPSSQRKVNSKVDWNNYNQVKAIVSKNVTLK